MLQDNNNKTCASRTASKVCASSPSDVFSGGLGASGYSSLNFPNFYARKDANGPPFYRNFCASQSPMLFAIVNLTHNGNFFNVWDSALVN